LTEKSVWQHWQSKRKRIARLRTEHVRSPRNILTKELSSAAYARRLTIRGWLIVLGAAGKASRELKIDISVALVWELKVADKKCSIPIIKTFEFSPYLSHTKPDFQLQYHRLHVHLNE
jgi:hypothetical protein